MATIKFNPTIKHFTFERLPLERTMVKKPPKKPKKPSSAKIDFEDFGPRCFQSHARATKTTPLTVPNKDVPLQDFKPMAEYPGSMENKVIELFMLHKLPLEWAMRSVKSDPRNNIKEIAGRRAVVKFAEDIIKLFLTTHGYDRDAMVKAFYKAALPYIPKHKRYAVSEREVAKGWDHMRWYVPEFEEAFNKAITELTFDKSNIIAYLTNLNNVFDDKLNDAKDIYNSKVVVTVTTQKGPNGESETFSI